MNKILYSFQVQIRAPIPPLHPLHSFDKSDFLPILLMILIDLADLLFPWEGVVELEDFLCGDYLVVSAVEEEGRDAWVDLLELVEVVDFEEV